MFRFTIAALAPFVLLAGGVAPAVALSATARMEPAESIAPIPVRQSCDADGRCYETGDPGFRDDAAPPPRRRFDQNDDDRPPPPRRRFDPDDNERPSPPPRRYDPDDDDRPPPRRRYDRDDDN